MHQLLCIAVGIDIALAIVCCIGSPSQMCKLRLVVVS
jgi:hypothetical protein